MSLSVNSNLGISNTLSTSNASSKALNQLSSGSRINSAADDAAGAAISDRITSKIGSFDAAIRNANDSISSIQVADGALQSLGDNIGRIQELALQAGNGALSDQDRQSLQEEADQLIDDSNRILEKTNFNGKNLLSSDDKITVQLDDVGKSISIDSKNVAKEFESLGFDKIDLSSQASVDSTLKTLNKASEVVLSRQSELGAASNRIENSVDNIATSKVNAAEARSRITDTDFAKAAAELAASQVRDQVQISVQAQANGQRSAVLQLLT
jgi:flagellin